MSGCGTHTLSVPEQARKACSGNCMGQGGCAGKMRVWLLAASGGRVAVFERRKDGSLMLLYRGDARSASGAEAFRQYMETAQPPLPQLVAIGSKEEIDWLHMVVPEILRGYMAAQMQQHLHAEWFEETPLPTTLQETLGRLFP